MGQTGLDLVFRIAGVAIVVSVIHSVIKQAGKEEYAWLFSLTAAVMVMMWVVQAVGEFFEKVRMIFRLY